MFKDKLTKTSITVIVKQVLLRGAGVGAVAVGAREAVRVQLLHRRARQGLQGGMSAIIRTSLDVVLAKAGSGFSKNST